MHELVSPLGLRQGGQELLRHGRWLIALKLRLVVGQLVLVPVEPPALDRV